MLGNVYRSSRYIVVLVFWAPGVCQLLSNLGDILFLLLKKERVVVAKYKTRTCMLILTCVCLFATLWTIYSLPGAPLFLGFPR